MLGCIAMQRGAKLCKAPICRACGCGLAIVFVVPNEVGGLVIQAPEVSENEKEEE